MNFSIRNYRLYFLCFFSNLLLSDFSFSAEADNRKVQLLFSKPGYAPKKDFGHNDLCGPYLSGKILETARGDNIRTASIHVAMYTLTSPGLLKALKEFSNKGGKVCIVLDDQQLNNNFGRAGKDMEAKLKKLKDETGNKVKLGILGSTVSPFQTLHEKFAIIDDGTGKTELILGSYNWTTNASRNNYENCVIVPSGQEGAIGQIKTHFDELWGLSRVYGGGVKEQACLFTAGTGAVAGAGGGVALPAVATASPPAREPTRPAGAASSSTGGRGGKVSASAASPARKHSAQTRAVSPLIKSGVGGTGIKDPRGASTSREPVAAPPIGRGVVMGGAVAAGASPLLTRGQRENSGRVLQSPFSAAKSSKK